MLPITHCSKNCISLLFEVHTSRNFVHVSILLQVVQACRRTLYYKSGGWHPEWVGVCGAGLCSLLPPGTPHLLRAAESTLPLFDP